MSDQADLIVIGAGIVGLSTAMSASAAFPDLRIVVLEKESQVAAHQTGHNSGVIHSGIYYRPGSLKAKFCAAGAAAMVDFCRRHDLPYEVCGKVVVATSDEQMPQLQHLHQRAGVNGVPNVRLISKEELREIEPHVSGVAALHVPTTGIADYAAVARKYADILVSRGGEVRTGSEVTGIREENSGLVVETSAGEFHTANLINCAGLFSDRIAAMTGARQPVQVVAFRGEYYEIVPERRSLVRALIYPVPDSRFPFLGVHFTRRVTGGIEAGPNAVLAFRREGYRKTDFSLRDCLESLRFSGFWNMSRRYWRKGLDEMWRSAFKSAFVRGLQQLVPEIESKDLEPAGAGVRAQALSPDGSLVDDFSFVPHGRALHVLNVPSPAATASLMIGKRIVEMAAEQFGWKAVQTHSTAER